MRLALGRALTVPLRHLLDEVGILQEDRSVGADGERVVVALDGDTESVVVAGGCVVMALPP